jgi:hypothetical protein
MWDFSLGGAMGLMVRTLPFLLLRLAVYVGMALAFLILTTIGAGIGWAIGGLGDAGFRAGSTFFGGLIGFSIVGGFAWIVRSYLLYLVKGAHIAVLVELIDGKEIPGGKGQITHGREVVQARFAESSILFGLDLLIKGVIRAVTGLARGMMWVLPIPGAKPLAGALNAFLKVAVGFLDEVILAYAIRTGSTNAWASARTALILYGQNWKPMMKNAAWLALFIYLLSFAIFLVMLLPASLFVWLMPGSAAIVGLIFALILAWAVKAALLEPLAVTCMMQVYFKTIEGQVPDPEWERRLTNMSGKFRKLTDKAFSGGSEPHAAAGQPQASAQEQGSTA